MALPYQDRGHDLRSAMVVAARHARNVNTQWKEVCRQLEPRLGPNKAVVAVARRMLVSVWHILTKRQPDRYADWGKVATGFMTLAYDDFGGAAHIPGGRTAPEFVRWCLDRLGVGEKLQRVKFSGKTYIDAPRRGTGSRAHRPRPAAEHEDHKSEAVGRGRRQAAGAGSETGCGRSPAGQAAQDAFR